MFNPNRIRHVIPYVDGSPVLAGYRMLAVAILLQAVKDIRRYPRGTEMGEDAREFFKSKRACAICPVAGRCDGSCSLYDPREERLMLFQELDSMLDASSSWWDKNSGLL